MANEKNLVPMSSRTSSERREIARKAGLASGAKRRSITSMREMAAIVMGLKPAVDEKMKRRIAEMGYDPESKDININFMTVLNLGQAAAKGDIHAAKLLSELNGDDANTVLQLAKIELERERLQIERMRIGTADDMASKANEKIMKLAELINSPAENRTLDGGEE